MIGARRAAIVNFQYCSQYLFSSSQKSVISGQTGELPLD